MSELDLSGDLFPDHDPEINELLDSGDEEEVLAEIHDADIAIVIDSDDDDINVPDWNSDITEEVDDILHAELHEFEDDEDDVIQIAGDPAEDEYDLDDSFINDEDEEDEVAV